MMIGQAIDDDDEKKNTRKTQKEKEKEKKRKQKKASSISLKDRGGRCLIDHPLIVRWPRGRAHQAARS
jgi:hypothetical protein